MTEHHTSILETVCLSGNAEESEPVENNTTENSLSKPHLSDNSPLEIQGATCAHYVARKKRQCKLQPLKHSTYCAEHVIHHVTDKTSHLTDKTSHVNQSENEHVPCPLDPAHFIQKSKLTKHLKVCNANKFVYTDQPYYKENVNVPEKSADSLSRQPLSALPLQDLIDTCTALARYGADNKVCGVKRGGEISEEDLAFYRPLSRTQGEQLGSTAHKHAVQQVALVKAFQAFHKQHTGEDSMSGNCFVELGAGKGNLSQWFDFSEKGNFFVLVDRQMCRRKADVYFKKEETNYVRLKMDIKDVDIWGISQVSGCRNVCVTCKHLCGGATDLALVAASRIVHHKPTSVLIALCCHHLCSWDTFTGKSYFLEHFQPTQFYTLCSMAAWATCFKMETIETANQEYLDKQIELFLDNPCQFVENDHLVLNKTLQWHLGRCAKTVLNDSRAVYMKDMGFHVEFATYVEVGISPENTALLCHKDRTC